MVTFMAKHPGGRPMKYNTREDLENAIDNYFDECKLNKKTIITKDGILDVISPKVPTIAGLAYAIGVDRQTVYNYEKNQEYFDIIKRARDYILAEIESAAINDDVNNGPVIFVMKNYGYSDKQEIEHSGGIEQRLNSDQVKEEIDKLLELRERDR